MAAALVGVSGSTALIVMTATPTAAGEVGTVLVAANDPDGETSAFSLDAGTEYLIEVSGSYTYGFQGGTADAECSNLPPDTTYERNRYVLLDPDGDLLDLQVDGRSVEWLPVEPDPLGCDGNNHVYRLLYVPDATGPVTFGVDDTGYFDNVGGFEVTVSTETEQLVDTVAVSSANPAGNASSVALDPTKSYRLEVSGDYSFGFAAGRADAECVDPIGGVPPTRNLLGLLLTPLDPSDDPLDLVVDGEFVEWEPVSGEPAGCDPSGTYELPYQVAASAPIRFSVSDGNHADNAGVLTVLIYERAVAPEPPPGGVPRVELAETVQVDSSDPDGSSTSAPLTAGESYLFEVSGTYAWGVGQADAECSTRVDTADPVWRRQRSFADVGIDDTTLLDLLVDGEDVEWVATDEDAEGCNTTDHIYRLVHVPETTGLTRFVISDGNFNDNSGVLTVKIFRITEVPVGSVEVDSSNRQGVNVPTAEGFEYRYAAAGTYFYGAGPSLADAECSNRADIADVTFTRDRFTSGGNDPLDLDIDAIARDWEPLMADANGCSTDHEYQVTATASGPVTNLAIDDVNHSDNFGKLTVEIFLQTS